MGRKKRRIFRSSKKENGKLLPDIQVHNALSVREERVSFGHSGAVSIHSGAKPTAGIISDHTEGARIEGKQILSIEDQIGQGTYERLKFFDEFFSDENKMSKGRVMVYSNSYPRRYTVVKFASENFDGNLDYQKLQSFEDVPIPNDIDGNHLEEYLRYLYAEMNTEIQYFEGMVDEEFQTMIKALFINKDLTMLEGSLSTSKSSEERVFCLTDMKNALYWLKGAIVPIITPKYLEALRKHYKEIMDGSINSPNLEGTYIYFRDNPNPGIRVLKLEEASENPFRHI